MNKNLTYQQSGVDVRKADHFVKAIKGSVSATFNPSVIRDKGAFGSLFAFNKKKYKNPILVSSTDGVGTKLLLANVLGKHDTVGIDLVAMNVNDILCTGAKPLFFLDYIACGQLNPSVLKKVMRGIVKGCRLADCSLIGGETAEMPGMYKGEDYDLAGFALGVVDKGKIINGSKIAAGDRLIGLASSGLHSNGFSLVRKVFSIKEQKKKAEQLLEPTRIYVKPVLDVIKKINVKGIAHITGGAFYRKLTKIVPQGKCFAIDQDSWTMPPLFQEIQQRGRITSREMLTTFNMGIGMVLVVSKKDATRTLNILKRFRIPSWEIGNVIKEERKQIVFI